MIDFDLPITENDFFEICKLIYVSGTDKDFSVLDFSLNTEGVFAMECSNIICDHFGIQRRHNRQVICQYLENKKIRRR